jgi:hypothetical protein
LVNVYSWLRDSGRFEEPPWLKELMKQGDPAKAISENALLKEQALCVESLSLYVSMLGSVAGNLALTSLAVGGVYLGGGIPPKFSCPEQGSFKRSPEAFVDFWLDPMRVLNDKAVLGAAHAAFEAWRAKNRKRLEILILMPLRLDATD